LLAVAVALDLTVAAVQAAQEVVERRCQEDLVMALMAVIILAVVAVVACLQALAKAVKVL
jgi:hypothetical protein